MEIITRKVQELTPYAQNTKKHDQKQIDNVANSIKRFGWQQPIVIDEQGVVVIGHCRLLAAKKLGLKEVPCTVASGLSDKEIRELRIADNKTNESPWDMEMLSKELDGLDFDGFDFPFPVEADEEESSTIYTSETRLPQYTPVGEDVAEQDLYDHIKTDALMIEIDGAAISKEQKDFLTMAAYRHTVFNYRKIAEYYATASPEMQRLMERSALVIIDLDDAIANGFTALTDTLEELMKDDIEGA